MRMSTPVALQDPAWTLDAAVHIAMRGFWSTLPALARSARRGEDARNMFSKNETEGFTAPPHWAPTVLAWEDEKKKPAEAGSEGCYKRLCSLTLHFAFRQRRLVEHTVFHDRQ